MRTGGMHRCPTAPCKPDSRHAQSNSSFSEFISSVCFLSGARSAECTLLSQRRLLSDSAVIVKQTMDQRLAWASSLSESIDSEGFAGA